MTREHENKQTHKPEDDEHEISKISENDTQNTSNNSFKSPNDKKKNQHKNSKSLKKHIRYVIFKGIMNYSLLVGFVLGLIFIILGIFETSFLAINLFLIMMGTIYSLFNIHSNKRIFQEFMTMIGTIVFVALLLTYISSTRNLIPIDDKIIGSTFNILQYILSIFVSLFMVPCIVAVSKLLFLNKKSDE